MRVHWGEVGLALTLAGAVAGSATTAATPEAPAVNISAPTRVAAQPSHIRLSGSIRGSYTIQRGNPDTGNGYILTGSGSVRPLGPSQANGEFHTLGFIASGQVSGRLVLLGSHGSLSLRLVGPKQRGFSPPPGSFHYDVASGTGTYQNTVGSGTLHLSLTNASTGNTGQFTLRF